MTKEEIAELIGMLPQGLDADDFIYKLVNWAIDIEREACAKVCEEYQWADRAADAIRARGYIHASDISQECVDETAKSKHEPLEQCSYPKCQATNGCVGVCSKGQPDLARVGEVGVWGDKREWVGFTHEELAWLNEALNLGGRLAVIEAIEAKLKEKNT
jgi:hypothetical protein